MTTLSVSQVYIIRLWSETREIEMESPILRGVIEHIWSGERRYFQEWAEALAFIVEHLEQDDAAERFAGDGEER